MKSKKPHASKASPILKVRIPIELKGQLEKAAKLQTRSVSNMVVFFLTQGVAHLDQKTKAS